jgi:AcrR family transcriptional regulator
MEVQVADTNKFKELPEEKQAAIVNAALKCFAKHGYRKASMNDIAETANISKALLFHYFGTKKDLYVFLVEYSSRIILNSIDFTLIEAEQDFFEQVRIASRMKITLFKKYPYVFRFVMSFWFETDDEIKTEKNHLVSDLTRNRWDKVLRPAHTQLKEGIDIPLVIRILTLVTEGYIAGEMSDESPDFDALLAEMERIYDFFKKYLYKEANHD